jgi:hypothetical protein
MASVLNVLSSKGLVEKLNTDERAEKLLGELQQWAMEAVGRPRDERGRFVLEVSERYYEDALRNGLTTEQAAAWRSSVREWLHELLDVIETSGGAGGGCA